MPVYELDTNITSEKIIKKAVNQSAASYSVIKYDDKYVCDNDENLGKYRSVVVAEPEGNILCYTPPKSITQELFAERNPDINVTDVLINEVVEGTMVSLFWDDRINAWELATKGAIGGNYWFYRTKYANIDRSMEQKTFRRMFLDALRASETQDINDLLLINELPKGTIDDRICYNFVLQHPDNPIVLTVEHPVIYLVSVYGIQTSSNKAVYVSPETYYGWKVWESFGDLVKFPSEQFDRTGNYDGVIKAYCSPLSNPNSVGIMITNTKTGDRACIENESYKVKRELRGNNPNLQYQFLCLKRVDKIMDFISHFPQYKKIFFRFHRQYEDFITQLHQSYVSYYVKKEGKPISKRFFPLIHKLHHDVYLPSISDPEKKIIMKRAVVRDHIVSLTPSEIIYYLNYTE
jgi:hypothetical protein